MLTPKRFVLGLLCACWAGAPASAQEMFLMNRDDWQALAPAQRAAYAAAVFDKSVVAIYGMPWTAAFAEGLQTCRGALGFTAADIAEKTTAAYARPKAQAGLAPSVLINSILNSVCRDYIDAANTRHGVD